MEDKLVEEEELPFSTSGFGEGCGANAFRAIGWASFKWVFKMERVTNSRSHFGQAYKGSTGVGGLGCGGGGGTAGFLNVTGFEGAIISTTKKYIKINFKLLIANFN